MSKYENLTGTQLDPKIKWMQQLKKFARNWMVL